MDRSSSRPVNHPSSCSSRSCASATIILCSSFFVDCASICSRSFTCISFFLETDGSFLYLDFAVVCACMQFSDWGKKKLSAKRPVERKLWTQTSSDEEKEKGLGKSSERIELIQLCFQNIVDPPSKTLTEMIPLKIGTNLNTSLHQKAPQGFMLWVMCPI
jgi:hypothetical protein